MVRKICSTRGCNNNLPTHKHSYCDRCKRIRMREQRDVYKSHNKRVGVNPGTRIALDEYRAVKALSVPKPRKPARQIMTDAEQLRINTAIADRHLKTDITDPRAYPITYAAAWLWR